MPSSFFSSSPLRSMRNVWSRSDSIDAKRMVSPDWHKTCANNIHRRISMHGSDSLFVKIPGHLSMRIRLAKPKRTSLYTIKIPKRKNTGENVRHRDPFSPAISLRCYFLMILRQIASVCCDQLVHHPLNRVNVKLARRVRIQHGRLIDML